MEMYFQHLKHDTVLAGSDFHIVEMFSQYNYDFSGGSSKFQLPCCFWSPHAGLEHYTEGLFLKKKKCIKNEIQ